MSDLNEGGWVMPLPAVFLCVVGPVIQKHTEVKKGDF